MSLILPPDKMSNPITLTMLRGSSGIMFKLHDVTSDVPNLLGEIVIPWGKVPALIDKLTEWHGENKPKHYHMVVDPAALGVVPSL